MKKESKTPNAAWSDVNATERKKADEAIRNSEDKYRNVIENMEEGYSEVDLTGNLTFCNDMMDPEIRTVC